jgi:cytochrome c
LIDTKRFHDRDLYIIVINLDGKILAHGQSRNLVGRNLINAKDPDGKLFITERVELALGLAISPALLATADVVIE